MASSVIANPGAMFIYKTYSCSYSIGGWEHKGLSASDFRISGISGYTPVGCFSFTSGNTDVSVVKIATATSGEVMQINNKPGSSTSGTAYISYLWIKNEFI